MTTQTMTVIWSKEVGAVVKTDIGYRFISRGISLYELYKGEGRVLEEMTFEEFKIKYPTILKDNSGRHRK